MADRRELEADFIAESRVFVGLFGHTYGAQMEWAQRVMPREAADHYIESWWQGRQTSLRYLRWLAERLRQEAGSEAGVWLDSFASTSSAVLQRMEERAKNAAPGAIA
ncbi:hypothetical protein GCM10028796_42600 [Ramlibacter monticola]|uniref:Uncharacterized protein n=1 Tax=Ramlibacter monticola TaxID=1926872 RepID=A0A936Z0V1_9BURK|nr:hypothetical protein [Ramlibacter monticola]MBL0392859.1 hypothetical protein [Ramlibacter monticola]